MLKRNGVVIDPSKSSDFIDFMKRVAKDEAFWKKNAEIASTSINKEDLDRLFGQNF